MNIILALYMTLMASVSTAVAATSLIIPDGIFDCSITGGSPYTKAIGFDNFSVERLPVGYKLYDNTFPDGHLVISDIELSIPRQINGWNSETVTKHKKNSIIILLSSTPTKQAIIEYVKELNENSGWDAAYVDDEGAARLTEDGSLIFNDSSTTISEIKYIFEGDTATVFYVNKSSSNLTPNPVRFTFDCQKRK